MIRYTGGSREGQGDRKNYIYSPVDASPFEMDHAQKTPEPLLPEL